MGFSYKEAMDMPENDAIAFYDTFCSINSPKNNPPPGNYTTGGNVSKGKTYKVRRVKK